MKGITQHNAGMNTHAGSLRAMSPLVWLFDTFCFTPWYTAALTSALKTSGARIRLFCSEFSREPNYFDDQGLQAEAGPIRMAQLASGAPRSVTRVLKVSDAVINAQAISCALRFHLTEKPSVIHLQQVPLLTHGLRTDLQLVELAQSAGIPVVHTVHNILPHDTGDRCRCAYGDLYQRVDHLICHSEDAAARLEAEFCVTHEKISVIPHGPLFAPDHPSTHQERTVARRRLGLPEDRPIVLLQGVLAEYKGLDVLLEAWKLCILGWRYRFGPPPLLLIAGSGDVAQEAMAKDAGDVGGGHVRADLGYIPTIKLPDYFAAADILVYPYRSITTSGALMTGTAYGKPIVASNLAPFREHLIHQQNALLVEPGDAMDLAASLLLLLLDLACTRMSRGLPDGVSLFQRLSQEALKRAATCPSWSAIAQQTLSVYDSLNRQKHMTLSCD
jgi:glycosyltransferase involved in cell wall biosynthesis